MNLESVIKDHYFKVFGVILHKVPQWQIDKYGKSPWGKGDCLFLSFIVAIFKQDMKLLKGCIQLLNERRRWPDVLNDPDIDSPNLFNEYLQKIILSYNKIAEKSFLPVIKWKIRYRCQRGMTRDPYVMGLIAWHILDGEGKCPINLPWYIMRPDFYFFYKWIQTGRSKYKNRYERYLTWYLPLKKSMPVYVTHLHCWKAFIMESETIKELLQFFIPHWNLLLYLLVNHPLKYHYTTFFSNYQSRNTYHWTRDSYAEIGQNGIEKLPDDAEYRPDKEILEWIIRKTD